MSSRRCVLLAGIMLCCLSLPSLAWTAEFSAVVVNQIAGQQMQGKIYVQGDKARLESFTPLGPVTSILRLDKRPCGC